MWQSKFLIPCRKTQYIWQNSSTNFIPICCRTEGNWQNSSISILSIFLFVWTFMKVILFDPCLRSFLGYHKSEARFRSNKKGIKKIFKSLVELSFGKFSLKFTWWSRTDKFCDMPWTLRHWKGGVLNWRGKSCLHVISDTKMAIHEWYLSV